MSTNSNGKVTVDRDRLIEILDDLTGDSEETVDALEHLGIEVTRQELSFTVTVSYRSLEPLSIARYVIGEAITDMLESEWGDADLAPCDDLDITVVGDEVHDRGESAPLVGRARPVRRKAAVRKAAVRKAVAE